MIFDQWLYKLITDLFLCNYLIKLNCFNLRINYLPKIFLNNPNQNADPNDNANPVKPIPKMPHK